MTHVTFQEPAQPDQVGTFSIARALPSRAVDAVGPFLLLDHLPRRDISPGKLPEPDGSFAHPHAGEYIWHVRIKPPATVEIALHADLPVAGYLPTQGAVVGDAKIDSHSLIGLAPQGGWLKVTNPAAEPLDLLLFGGQAITDPIAMRGPFVMNSDGELAQAFRAYHAGTFGQITYPAGHAAHKA
ncbi:pirin-like C-terminal cupin domain-containing protein [Loktanella salsilacus]|uniref:pirin-like C-terminal cupin domain-containing protein n=1 Tax=Loktanella salsilacus TaxID=195913 RepID=UPI00373651CD